MSKGSDSVTSERLRDDGSGSATGDLSNPPLHRAILYVVAERSQSVEWCIINPSMRKSIFVAALSFTFRI